MEQFLRNRLIGFTLIPILILSGIIPLPGFGQIGIIKSLDLEGNSRTRATYLRHFMNVHEGMIMDSASVADDLRRLRNLPSIMDAQFEQHSNDSGEYLVYRVKERFTLFPVGDFGISEDNFWIGGGLMESNLLGRGLYAYGYYQYSERHTLHLIFRNPYIAGSKWGVEFQLKKMPSVEISPSYGGTCEMDFFAINLGARYEFQPENDMLIGTSYRLEEADYLDTGDPEYPHTDEKRIAQEFFVRHEVRKLDYHGFYVNGWRNVVNASLLFPYNDFTNAVIMIHDQLEIYLRLFHGSNLAIRAQAGLSFPEWSPFDPFIADSYYNFRGIGYRAYRGNLTAVLNLEYRQTLWENRWGGIQAILFTDNGFIGRSDSLTASITAEGDKGGQLYGGVGIRFIYKKAYDAILSIDYGIDMLDLWDGGWVISWGQYF